MIKNKQFGVLLLVFYLFLIVYIYCYYFLILIEPFDNTNPNPNSSPKRKIKYIYILNLNDDEKITENNKEYRYSFYNKNYKRYLKVYGQFKNHKKQVLLKDYEDTIIGNFKESRYNIDVIKTGLYADNINFEYSQNYNKVIFYIANDENVFSIVKKKNEYLVYLYGLHIGKIKYNKEKKIYSVIVYEEYKIYLNLIGIAFIMLVNN